MTTFAYIKSTPSLLLANRRLALVFLSLVCWLFQLGLPSLALNVVAVFQNWHSSSSSNSGSSSSNSDSKEGESTTTTAVKGSGNNSSSRGDNGNSRSSESGNMIVGVDGGSSSAGGGDMKYNLDIPEIHRDILSNILSVPPQLRALDLSGIINAAVDSAPSPPFPSSPIQTKQKPSFKSKRPSNIQSERTLSVVDRSKALQDRLVAFLKDPKERGNNQRVVNTEKTLEDIIMRYIPSMAQFELVTLKDHPKNPKGMAWKEATKQFFPISGDQVIKGLEPFSHSGYNLLVTMSSLGPRRQKHLQEILDKKNAEEADPMYQWIVEFVYPGEEVVDEEKRRRRSPKSSWVVLKRRPTGGSMSSRAVSLSNGTPPPTSVISMHSIDPPALSPISQRMPSFPGLSQPVPRPPRLDLPVLHQELEAAEASPITAINHDIELPTEQDLIPIRTELTDAPPRRRESYRYLRSHLHVDPSDFRVGSETNRSSSSEDLQEHKNRRHSRNDMRRQRVKEVGSWVHELSTDSNETVVPRKPSVITNERIRYELPPREELRLPNRRRSRSLRDGDVAPTVLVGGSSGKRRASSYRFYGQSSRLPTLYSTTEEVSALSDSLFSDEELSQLNQPLSRMSILDESASSRRKRRV